MEEWYESEEYLVLLNDLSNALDLPIEKINCDTFCRLLDYVYKQGIIDGKDRNIINNFHIN